MQFLTIFKNFVSNLVFFKPVLGMENVNDLTLDSITRYLFRCLMFWGENDVYKTKTIINNLKKCSEMNKKIELRMRENLTCAKCDITCFLTFHCLHLCLVIFSNIISIFKSLSEFNNVSDNNLRFRIFRKPIGIENSEM